ncbi:putative polysaccharide biosynthesis protein [Levilactobacillus spicheri]|uniref:Sugar transporter n=1 Tax=Levilactobacillus spicheri TaxID=216463 RepID=A0A0F3RR91_9LACO|nr:polysaccharide biosynthesis protein [Levilactobacillus spicheri]KJW12516.1 sugar transporter [Levilactobacillus spicheri]
MNKKIISGTFWLSFGSIASRILGIVYLIPWLYMIGSPYHQTAAQALFNTAYTPYALFIALGTAGFPSAVARRVAYFNGKDEPENARRVGHIGFAVMLLSGVICGVLLYGLAPLIARNSPVASTNDAIIAIRSLVPAIVILPSMSVLRGWFQGNSDLKPFGISQLWEQFVRIVTILVGTYLIIEVFGNNYKYAVFVSVFAAFVGAVASYAYLLKKLAAYRQPTTSTANQASRRDLLRMIRVIVYESIPFIFVGSGITLCQLFDQLFFKQIMQGALHFSAVHTQYAFTIFSANPNKITTVVVSLAMAISETSLPLISSKIADIQANRTGIQRDITSNLNLMVVCLLPAVLMVCALSYPIYGIFFNFDRLGGTYLIYNVLQSFILGMAINVLTVMQALRMSKRATVILLEGLAIKLVLQYPLVYLWQGLGAILATGIAFGFVLYMSVRVIRRHYALNLHSLKTIGLVNLAFLAVILLITVGMHLVFPLTELTSKLVAMVYVAVFGLLYLAIYLLLINRTGLSEQLFHKKLGYKYFRYKHFG